MSDNQVIAAVPAVLSQAIAAVVVLLVLAFVAIMIATPIVQRRKRKRSVEEQEASMTQKFSRGHHEVQLESRSFTIPWERVEEIAEQHGYSYVKWMSAEASVQFFYVFRLAESETDQPK